MSAYTQMPVARKPKLCVWTDLNVYNMDQILKCGNTMETRSILQKIFGIDDSPRGQILLDLYMHVIAFSKLHKFSKEQASAFFSIVKQSHEVCVSTPFGNVDECFSFFRELVLTHSVHRPPWSLEIFNAEQVETITKHVINTYFRHYKFYKYTFTPKVRLDITLQYEGLAPSPPPEQSEELQDDAAEPTSDVEGAQTPSPVEESADLEEVTPKEEPNLQNENSLELENIVRKAVGAQLKQMHVNVERQLEDTDKAISEKIQALELGGSGTPKGGKSRSPKASAKGKKKP